MSDDINWKELSVDKSIDAILIPVGLFAALYFQGWVDDRKDREDYGALIADFRTEAETNRGRSAALAASIGPFSDTDPETVLGPMNEKFDDLGTHAESLSKAFDCFDLFVDAAAEHPSVMSAFTDEDAPAPADAPAAADAPAPAPTEGDSATAEGEAAAPAAADAPAPTAAPTAAMVKEVPAALLAELAACADILDAKDSSKFKPFAGADLSPVYQYVTWQVYLQSGIKLFKDSEAKGLGKLLGAAYASKREVEKRVEEVEGLFNDGLMKASARLAALDTEFEDLFPEEPTVEALKEIQERVRELSGEAIELGYETENARTVIGLKVGLLKRLMVSMDGELESSLKGIASEEKRLGSAPAAPAAPAPAAPAAPAPAAPAAPAPAAPAAPAPTAPAGN